jgi:hypothetical protein
MVVKGNVWRYKRLNNTGIAETEQTEQSKVVLMSQTAMPMMFTSEEPEGWICSTHCEATQRNSTAVAASGVTCFHFV